MSKNKVHIKLLVMFSFDVKVYLMTSQPLADFLLMPLYNMLFAYWINICFGNQQKHFLPIIRVFPDGFQDSITFQTKLSKLVVCCWADGFFLWKSRIRKLVCWCPQSIQVCHSCGCKSSVSWEGYATNHLYIHKCFSSCWWKSFVSWGCYAIWVLYTV